MAVRLALHYLPGHSLLHRWDPRCKFLGFSALAVGILHLRLSGLLVLTLAFPAALALARLPARTLLRDLQGWALFLAAIFLLQAFLGSGPGAAAPTGWITLNGARVRLAALVCWRLGLMLCYAVLFTAVTQPRALQDALTWFLQPIPYVPARRVALMMTLTLRFLPITLDQLAEIRTAVKARLGDRPQSPLRRVKFLILPLFRNALGRSEEFALALAARGYNEDLPVRLAAVPAAQVLGLMLLIMALIAGSGWCAELLRSYWHITLPAYV